MGTEDVGNPALMEHLDIDDSLEKVIAILFGNALSNGDREISWEDAPKLLARLERAGLDVKGGFAETGRDFGRGGYPVITVSVNIRVKGIAVPR